MDRFGRQIAAMNMERDDAVDDMDKDGDVIYYEMPMYFWQGHQVIFVINGWESTDGFSYAIGCLLTLIFGFLLEGLIVFRTYLAKMFHVKNLDYVFR